MNRHRSSPPGAGHRSRVLLHPGAIIGVLAAVAIAFLGVIASTQTVAAQTSGAQTADASSGIQVTGIGTTTLEADRAFVTLGVEATADTVTEARSQAAAALDDVIRALLAKGLTRDDLPTADFRIQPQYGDPTSGGPVPSPGGGTPQIIGFTVTNLVEAQIDDIDRVGEIIDAAVAAGGDLIRVQNIRFAASQQEAAFDQAIESAIDDARSTAERVAELTGVELGAVRYVSVSGNGGTPRPLAAPAGGVGGETPIQPGQLTVTVSVTITYAITGQ